MTNRLALVLGLLVAGFFVLDVFVLHWDSHIVLMRGLADLTRQMAFWR